MPGVLSYLLACAGEDVHPPQNRPRPSPAAWCRGSACCQGDLALRESRSKGIWAPLRHCAVAEEGQVLFSVSGADGTAVALPPVIKAATTAKAGANKKLGAGSGSRRL